MPIFKIPSQLRNFTGNKSTIDVSGGNVLEAVNNLVEKHQELKNQIFKKNKKMFPFVSIFVNNENIRFIDNLETKLDENAELSIILTADG